MTLPLVIKLGGAALESSETLTKLFIALQKVQQQSRRSIVVVHGGGYLVDELLQKLQFTSTKKNGLRVTPQEQIPFITGALAGTANKMLQGEAVKVGLKTVGLSLADGGLCHVEQLDPELGAVGKVSPGDSSLLQAILATHTLPIISSIGLTEAGSLMNVNADQAAVAVAGALDAELVLLSNVSGVLDGKGDLLESLTEQQANELIEAQVITDGMIVKVQAALQAASDLGRPIQVASWQYPEKLEQLFAGQTVGTLFQPE